MFYNEIRTMESILQEQNNPFPWIRNDADPYEKLRYQGSEILSETELISILLDYDRDPGQSIPLSREILNKCRQNLRELGKMSLGELLKFQGMDRKRAILLQSALELARRREQSNYLEKVQIANSSDMARYLQAKLRDKRQEAFLVVFLNRSHKILHLETVSTGGITGTVADPRIILKKALEEEAMALILCHNHPSGNVQPSKADEELTHRIREAARYHDIQVLDHIIVSDVGFFSFADQGML
jgi:DNA repair protein RadC